MNYKKAQITGLVPEHENDPSNLHEPEDNLFVAFKYTALYLHTYILHDAYDTKNYTTFNLQWLNFHHTKAWGSENKEMAGPVYRTVQQAVDCANQFDYTVYMFKSLQQLLHDAAGAGEYITTEAKKTMPPFALVGNSGVVCSNKLDELIRS